MKARYEIIVRYVVAQEIETIEEMLDHHDIANTAACTLCDELTAFKAATTFEVLESVIDVR